MAKKQASSKVRCLDCRNATLLRWDNNPIIVSCPQIGKDVASVYRNCIHFEKNMKEPLIIQKTHWP